MKTLEESTLRAWREYRNDNTLPSENFEAGYALGHRDALALRCEMPEILERD